MSVFLDRIKDLVAAGNVRISSHGHDELAEDNIYIRDIIAGIADAFVVENYPNYPKGPCILTLQRDREIKPVHAVWGIPKGKEAPALLITAYRPDPEGWSHDFTSRLK